MCQFLKVPSISFKTNLIVDDKNSPRVLIKFLEEGQTHDSFYDFCDM